MTTEQAFSHPGKYDRPERAAPIDPAVLPSHRIVVPLMPGTEEAEFLANLNEVYGAEDPEDDQIIEGIRRTMRAVLDRTP